MAGIPNLSGPAAENLALANAIAQESAAKQQLDTLAQGALKQ